MSKHQPFVIPAGVRLEITDNSASIEHAGDVIIHGGFRKNLERVVSHEGSVVLRGEFNVEHLEAPRGTVRLEGPIRANRVHASNVEIVGSTFQGKAVRGSRQVIIGETRITADIVMAPRVEINPKASGRIPVVECHNDTGSTAIKGCFNLREYEELIGDAGAFLAERGLSPLEPAPDEDGSDEEDAEEEPSGAVIETSGADDAPAPVTGEEESVEDPDTSPGPLPVVVPVEAGFHVKVQVPPMEDLSLPVNAPVVEVDSYPEVNLEAMEEIEPIAVEQPPANVTEDSVPTLAQAEFSASPVTERVPVVAEEVEPAPVPTPAPPVDDPVYRNLLDAIRGLKDCYDAMEVPPVLRELDQMVEARDYDGIRVRLPQIWNELVKFHREKGLRIRRQVTTTFNTIMNLVKTAHPA